MTNEAEKPVCPAEGTQEYFDSGEHVYDIRKLLAPKQPLPCECGKFEIYMDATTGLIDARPRTTIHG